MTALSPLFLWLLPLALLPVILHLLNRLRYHTVKWAAMMFLRTADRDSSRRAKIRQWLILGTRCLMLTFFLLSLVRLQTHSGFARFLDRDSGRIILIFDRSPGMEQTRGGISSRERALGLLAEGLSELRGRPRIVWIDSATGETLTLPPGIDPASLPHSAPTQAPVSIEDLLRRALALAATEKETATEIWIATDRRASAWFSRGGSAPDWTDWANLSRSVTLRLLDVGSLAPDSGNRTLALAGPPRRQADRMRVDLRLNRDRSDPETVPLQIEAGGLRLREDIRVEGHSFQWTQDLPIDPSAAFAHALLHLPADSNPLDNTVAVSLPPPRIRTARLDLSDPAVHRATRAALLPRSGEREVPMHRPALSSGVDLWVREAGSALLETEIEWIRRGGTALSLPRSTASGALSFSEEEGRGIRDGGDPGGILGPGRFREPLRLDLLRIFQAVSLAESDHIEVLARLDNGMPLLTLERIGEGVHYRLATLPLRNWSTLDAGFVWVPVMQRLLAAGETQDHSQGTHWLGDWRPEPDAEWTPLDGGEADPRLHVGLFEAQGQVVALNRAPGQDIPSQLSLPELREWTAPFGLRVFEDRRMQVRSRGTGNELTPLLALLGLVFLALESALLTRNIRRTPTPRRPNWRRGAA